MKVSVWLLLLLVVCWLVSLTPTCAQMMCTRRVLPLLALCVLLEEISAAVLLGASRSSRVRPDTHKEP